MNFIKNTLLLSKFKKRIITAFFFVLMIINNPTNPIIILGSSRSHGETGNAVKMINPMRQFPLLILNEKNISYFDYENKKYKRRFYFCSRTNDKT